MNLRVVEPTSAQTGHKRNPGFPLDLDLVESVRMNRSALERRAATIGTRRSVKKEWQSAWLLKAITLMDLTTLNSDDTPGRVERLYDGRASSGGLGAGPVFVGAGNILGPAVRGPRVGGGGKPPPFLLSRGPQGITRRGAATPPTRPRTATHAHAARHPPPPTRFSRLLLSLP